MIYRDELTAVLYDFLDVGSFVDYGPNGLQIEGRDEISTIVTGVTACYPLIEQAVELEADAVLVHHGLFWDKEDPSLVGVKYKRVKSFIQNNINLFAYHLPLDIHDQIGNNVVLADVLDFECESRHSCENIPNIVSFGSSRCKITSAELKKKITEKLKREPLYISANPKRVIKKVAWCSGGGQNMLDKAAALGADAFITGEVSLKSAHMAEDLGIDYYAAGHNATEVFGIRALGSVLAKKFNLQHYFIDVDMPV